MLISIDTEFERRNTYRPILSIVQVKEEGNKAVIYDVRRNKLPYIEMVNYSNEYIKTSNDDIEYLKNILSDKNNIKIIHASRQDIEAVYCCLKIIMKNVFDTQIAAKCLGFGNELGYTKLVQIVCGKEITKEKRLQHSNWLKRPLSIEQIFYAKQDVEYLEQIYFKLNEMFKNDKQSFEKFKQECKEIEDEKYYVKPGGENIKVPAGTYDFYLNDITGYWSIAKVAE